MVRIINHSTIGETNSFSTLSDKYAQEKILKQKMADLQPAMQKAHHFSCTNNRILNKAVNIQIDLNNLQLLIKQIEQKRDEIQQQAVLIRQDETLIKKNLDNAEQKWIAIQTKASVVQQIQKEIESQKKEIQQKQDLIQQRLDNLVKKNPQTPKFIHQIIRHTEQVRVEEISFMNSVIIENLTLSFVFSPLLTLLKKILDLSYWIFAKLRQLFT